MNAGGLGVTPELLTGAADTIDAAVRDGDLGSPPVPAGGADYGHPGMADAVAQLGAAIRAATQALLAGAERNSTGLRAGANAYLAQEQAALRAVNRERAGLAGLMGAAGPGSAVGPIGAAGPGGLAGPGSAAGPSGLVSERRAG